MVGAGVECVAALGVEWVGPEPESSSVRTAHVELAGHVAALLQLLQLLLLMFVMVYKPPSVHSRLIPTSSYPLPLA